MNYIQLLRRIHKARGNIDLYLEIGCDTGASLSISRATESIAIDPAPQISHDLRSPTHLYKMTSDQFFADHASKALKGPIDLAFIDGMHLSEFALRDFINVERCSHPGGWVVFDDVLPADMSMASRTRQGDRWTGDVYKLIDVLRRYRPDLDVRVFDVDLKGLMLVRGLDPESRVLAEAYPEIAAELTRADEPDMTLDQMRQVARPIPPDTASTGWLATTAPARAQVEVVKDALILAGQTPMPHHGVYRANGVPCPETAVTQGRRQMTGHAPARMPEATARLDGAYIHGGMIAGHFGHMMLETFARLSVFDTTDLPVIFTQARQSKPDHFWALAKAMDLPQDRIVVVDQPTQVAELHIMPANFVIRERIEPAFVSAYAAIGTRIAARLGVRENSDETPAYLSRSKTARGGRYYHGEALVERILARHGVDILYLEDLSMEEQIKTWLTRARIGGFAGSAFHMGLFASAPKHLTYLTTHMLNRNFRLIEGLKQNAHEVCVVASNPVAEATLKTGPFLLSRDGIVEACRAMGVAADLSDVPEADYAACVAAYHEAIG